MDRQSRRAAEKQTLQDFSEFQAMYRRISGGADDRAIGLAWMRGQHHNRFNSIALCPGGEMPPADLKQLDIKVSANYRSQFFEAYLKSKHIDLIAGQWPQLIMLLREIPDAEPSPLSGDLRRDARSFILEMIVGNYHVEDDRVAAYVGCAITWLGRTSVIGEHLGRFHKHIHYAISDDPAGGLAYSILLSQQHLHPRPEHAHDNDPG
jgi:hypothetical protein